MIVEFKCRKCSNPCDKHAKFCSECGVKNPVEEKEKLPYIGSDIDTGIYRITFDPVEDEFSHIDSVNDAVRHSTWGEDGSFKKSNIEFVRSTVARETHPYICNKCQECVSEHIEGKCMICGVIEWVKRTGETEKKKDED